MNKIKNEHGYALVSVLLIIVIFMLLFLAFASQSFSTMKQNQVVEKTSQSVSIAEMGIAYYHVAVTNTFLAKQDYYDNKLRTETNPSFTETTIINDIISSVKTKLEGGKINFPVDTNNSFTVEDTAPNKIIVGVDPTNNEIVNIEFSVTGNTKNEKKKTLRTKMNINLEDLTVHRNISLPEFNNIPEVKAEDVSTSCKPPLLDTFVVTTSACPNGVFIDTDKSYSDKFQMYLGKIYSTADLTLDGNGQKSSLTVHAENLTLGGNLNNMNKATFETENNLTLNGHAYGEGLSFYVDGNLLATDRFQLFNSSDFTNKMYYSYVRGNATFEKKAEIQSKNVMCINGNVKADAKIDVYGKLYVRDGLPHTGLEDIPSDKIIFVTNEDLTNKDKLANLQSICGNTFDVPEKNIEWGENAKTIVDVINY